MSKVLFDFTDPNAANAWRADRRPRHGRHLTQQAAARPGGRCHP
jgi:hypothetical protein